MIGDCMIDAIVYFVALEPHALAETHTVRENTHTLRAQNTHTQTHTFRPTYTLGVMHWRVANTYAERKLMYQPTRRVEKIELRKSQRRRNCVHARNVHAPCRVSANDVSLERMSTKLECRSFSRGGSFGDDQEKLKI